METLNNFVQYAIAEGYEAKVFDDSVYLYNVKNPNNDFKMMEVNGSYSVYTIRVSQQDLEYTAKCTIYVLLAEYNKAHSQSNHLHINFRVEL